MITKAYVQTVIDESTVVVRMPLFNKISEVSGSTPDSELPIATLCIVPGAEYVLEEGDIVFLGFEEDNISTPVVLGVLSRYNKKNSKINLNLLDLYVDQAAKLPYQTTIGDVSAVSISCLQGLDADQNIRNKFIELDEADKEMAQDILDLQTADIKIQEELKNSVALLNASIQSNSDKIDANTEKISQLDINKLDKNKIILGGSAYGDRLPENMAEGQVFFLTLSGYESGDN